MKRDMCKVEELKRSQGARVAAEAGTLQSYKRAGAESDR